MKIFAQWLLFFILAAILLAYVSGEAADKQTSRLYARAHVIETQSEARKDMMTFLMPITIIGLSAIGGTIAIIAMTYGLVAVATIWINRPQQARPPDTIIMERQMIIMLQPGQTRREVWQQVSDIKLIKGN